LLIGFYGNVIYCFFYHKQFVLVETSYFYVHSAIAHHVIVDLKVCFTYFRSRNRNKVIIWQRLWTMIVGILAPNGLSGVCGVPCFIVFNGYANIFNINCERAFLNVTVLFTSDDTTDNGAL
jgi:hypothetical protein